MIARLDKEMEDGGAIKIRPCESLEDIDACLDLQKKTWGKDDTDLMPRSGFLIARSNGGQVLGAWRETAGKDEQLVGFALAYISVVEGETFLYSHLLAVDPASRNLGIGRALKLMQREDALKRGIERIEWTFDPLEIKNSCLNIEKLGAIARRYHVNQYGMTSSPLQGGLPSDRLIAEWWLRSKRVETLLATGRNPPFNPQASIEVPSQIYEWKATAETRGKAQQVQERNREEFLQRFATGLAVLGYTRDAEGSGKFLLGEWDEKWSYASED
jgi:predicted GNAT superfamily acetyltransferase